MGFRLLEEERNKGYGTGRAIAHLNFGLEKRNSKRIIKRAIKEDAGSISVLEKLAINSKKMTLIFIGTPGR